MGMLLRSYSRDVRVCLFWGHKPWMSTASQPPSGTAPPVPSQPPAVSCYVGLTGQRVNALGELVLLPGPAFELAAEHVAVVLLLHLRRLRGLRVGGRLRGFLGWSYGMTRATT